MTKLEGMLRLAQLPLWRSADVDMKLEKTTVSVALTIGTVPPEPLKWTVATIVQESIIDAALNEEVRIEGTDGFSKLPG